MEPLNPELFNLLKRTFGTVRISNEGESMVAHYTEGATGREELYITNPGEYYRVCCPRCNDSRYRLYINHMWGVPDERGRRNLWLALCYNENCYSSYDDAMDLLEEITEMEGVARFRDVKIRPGKKVTESPVASMPGLCRPLHELPPTHAANRYLASRGFDPERLSRIYGIQWCQNSHYHLARNRIIVPIFMQGVLRGWQARFIGTPSSGDKHIPKWWNDPQMKKRAVLYNFDKAVKFETGIILEGPGKVWNLGSMGMATLGSSMSLEQARMLQAGFRGRSRNLVLLWDADVLDDPKKIVHVDNKVRAWLDAFFPGRFAVVWPPDGVDPDEIDRRELRRYIEREARGQGVKVSWKLYQGA